MYDLPHRIKKPKQFFFNINQLEHCDEKKQERAVHPCSLLSMDSPAVACEECALCSGHWEHPGDLGSCAWLSNGMLNEGVLSCAVSLVPAPPETGTASTVQ